MANYIDRQAAIAEFSCCELTPDGGIDANYAIDFLKQLPSAQPEIIRCTECKHHWTHKCMDSMPIERCDLEQTFYDAEIDFCSLAERRTE